MIAASEEADRNLVGSPSKNGLRFCHEYWAEKKRILKERHGLEWRSPAELNRHIIFD
jgi:hypothetical protein